MATIKTVLRAFYFNISDPRDAAAWAKLKAEREAATPTECFEAHGGSSHYLPDLDGVGVELDTTQLFNNQWNLVAPKALRVFDWAMDYHSHSMGTNPNIKKGHYLEQTQEMQDIRANTLACGYCGKQEPLSSGLKFCPHCLGSEYLKAEDLYLTRMFPVSSKRTRAKLTEAERAELMPRYIEAQTKGITERDKAQIAKARADVIDRYEKVTTNALTERNGMLWLMDHGLRTDNVIYYTHTGRFCFGWRTPLSGELFSRTLDIVTEFPYEYDIKKA